MKFAISSLPSAIATLMLIGVSSHTVAASTHINTDSDSQPLNTLVDPITHKSIANSYPIEVSSHLSLEQAQDILLQVSPKLAANQAAIAASEYQTDALKTIDRPFVFARMSASTYTIQEDIDLSSLRNEIISGVNEVGDNIGDALPSIPPPNIPDFGERIPNSHEFKRSGSTSGAGLGFAWPVYTAGRTAALTGASSARTQEAIADSVLDKNELYNTLIERYFKAQLAIIAAYLREDAYDTLQQTDHMAQRLFEEGFISRVDRLEAQSALADAKSESIKANNDARLAMIALQRLLRTDYRIKPTTPLFVSSRPLPDIEYFQQLALNNHPAYKKWRQNAHKRSSYMHCRTLATSRLSCSMAMDKLKKTPAGLLVSLPVGSSGAVWINPHLWRRALLKFAKPIFRRLRSVIICYYWSKRTGTMSIMLSRAIKHYKATWIWRLKYYAYVDSVCKRA